MHFQSNKLLPNIQYEICFKTNMYLLYNPSSSLHGLKCISLWQFTIAIAIYFPFRQKMHFPQNISNPRVCVEINFIVNRTREFEKPVSFGLKWSCWSQIIRGETENYLGSTRSFQPNSPRRSRGLFGWDRGISVTPSLILAKWHRFLKSPSVVFYL